QNLLLEEKVKERTLELEITNHFLSEAKERAEEGERKLHQLNAEREIRVRERTEELEASNRDLEAFSCSVSHDLKAPLRHITGFVEILSEMEIHRSEAEIKYLRTISNGAKEMDKIIEALLSFSRMSRKVLNKTTIQTQEMVAKVIGFLEAENKGRNLTFRIGSLPNCKGDEQLIKQVWINLVSNAVKYSGKKTDAIIEIGSKKKSNEILFYVKDNGDGFDMKNVEKLFGMFQRLHKTSDFEGNGIGLANIKRIVTRHGGTCSAEGEPGVGATFSFTLPC
ncbi:MAG: ATP-binding protein, partial [Bacteroidota bacterium]